VRSIGRAGLRTHAAVALLYRAVHASCAACLLFGERVMWDSWWGSLVCPTQPVHDAFCGTVACDGPASWPAGLLAAAAW
jgi:hypothetical protein